MNETYSTEILINAARVNMDSVEELYEFVLDEHLRIVECVRIESLIEGIVSKVDNFGSQLNKVLFELNHVRVNPSLDNTWIIGNLTRSLKAIGVRVMNQPAHDHMSACFRPLGEIKDTVRFYFDEKGKVVFLSPKGKLDLVYNKPKSEVQPIKP